MRETGEFNCVGATLLGISLLEKAGISSQYSNPYEHIVNIIQLSNGEWWYVDFRNGTQNIIKLEAEETKIANVPTLKIDQANIDYKILPLYDNSEITGSVLGNLSALQHETEDESIPDEDIEKKEAQQYLAQYNNTFQKIDFSLLHESLYPDLITMSQSDEMKKEKERIHRMRNFEKPVSIFIKSLTKQQEAKLIKEIQERKNDIENFFYMDDNAVLDTISPELKKVLELFQEGLKDLKEKYPKTYKEAVDNIVSRIKNL